MSHREKLQRAYTHLKSLDDAVKTFIESKPYTEVRHNNPNGCEVTWHLQKRRNLPDELGLIVGDSIYNMRSALDHLAFALAEKHSGATLNENAVNFPIGQQSDFVSERGSGTLAISQMSPSVQDAIKAMQPDAGPHSPDRHPLRILNKLSNIDKHRRMAFTGSVAFGTTTRINPASKDVRARVEGADIRVGPFDDQTEVVHLYVEQTGPEPRVIVDTDFKIEIAFPESGPAAGEIVFEVLAGVYWHIENVVFAKLEPFLS